MCFLPHFVMCAHRQTGTHTHTQPHTLPLCKHLFSHSTSLPDHNFYYQRRALQLPLLLLNFVGAGFRQAGAAALPAPALPARLPASHRETLKLNWPRKKHLDVNKHVCLLRQGEKKKNYIINDFCRGGFIFCLFSQTEATLGQAGGAARIPALRQPRLSAMSRSIFSPGTSRYTAAIGH